MQDEQKPFQAANDETANRGTSDSQSTPGNDPDKTLIVPSDGPATLQPNEAGLRYHVLRPHAKGGLGEVFVARDVELNREVALKEIQIHHADDRDSRSRFVLEAEVTGGLEHPGIVPVYGLGQYQDGRPYYAMRFIRGDSLQQAVDRFHAKALAADEKGMSEGETAVEFRKLLGQLVDVCNAIQYAHSRGVLHRDLKPDNVMLGKYGETLVVDWGLAKAQGRDHESGGNSEENLQPASGSGSAATQLGSAIGTPAFMPPEQAGGRIDELGPASDVYSLGATLYYVLTGKSPFRGKDLVAMLDKVQRGEFPPPRSVKPDVPKPLDAICRRAMATEPAARYGSPQDLADDVERYLADEPVSVHTEPFAVRARRWLRKHPKSVAALAATILVGLVSTAVIASVVSQNAKIVAEKNQKLYSANEKLEGKNEDLEKRMTQIKKGNEILGSIFMDLDPNFETKGGESLRVQLGKLLERATEELDAEAVGDPLDVAQLQYTLGSSQLGLGYAEKAIQLLEKARAVRTAKLGKKHLDTLKSMNKLASAYGAADRLTDALPLFEETLRLRKEKLGPNDLDTLMSMNNLALAYKKDGKLDKALPIFEEMLPLWKAKAGPKADRTITAMHNLAFAYQAAGRFDEALPIQEVVLKLREAQLGVDHPSTLMSMNNLAFSLLRMDRTNEAVTIYKKLLPLSKVKLGEKHPETLRAMANLAQGHLAAGRLKQAMPLLHETFKLRLETLGPKHVDTLTSMHDFAFGFLNRSDASWREALPMLEETLKRQKANLPPGHPELLNTMNSLGVGYQKDGQHGKALRLFKETLRLRKAIQSADHPGTRACMINLAATYKAAGQPAEAVAIYEQLLQLQKKKPGPTHAKTLSTIHSLAAAYLSAGKPEKASPLFKQFIAINRQRAKQNEPRFAMLLAYVSNELLQHQQYSAAEAYLRECLEISERVTPKQLSVFITRSMLGAALSGQKKFAEAEPLLIAGYKGMKQRESTIAAAAKIRVTEALQRLVDLYTSWKKPKELEKWKEELKNWKK